MIIFLLILNLILSTGILYLSVYRIGTILGDIRKLTTQQDVLIRTVNSSLRSPVSRLLDGINDKPNPLLNKKIFNTNSKLLFNVKKFLSPKRKAKAGKPT